MRLPILAELMKFEPEVLEPEATVTRTWLTDAEFAQRVEELQAGGLSRGDAVRQAMEEDR